MERDLCTLGSISRTESASGEEPLIADHSGLQLASRRCKELSFLTMDCDAQAVEQMEVAQDQHARAHCVERHASGSRSQHEARQGGILSCRRGTLPSRQ